MTLSRSRSESGEVYEASGRETPLKVRNTSAYLVTPTLRGRPDLPCLATSDDQEVRNTWADMVAYDRKTCTIPVMTTSIVSTAQRVREHVCAQETGEPFSVAELRELGPRNAVYNALSRLAHEGVIDSVVQGVYVRPQVNRFVGAVPPNAESVARAIASATNSVIEVHGAEAARQFGLTTQVPMHQIFITTGRARKVHIGAAELELRHVEPSRILFAGTLAGRAFSALKYLGRREVTPEIVEKVASQLPPEELIRLVEGRTKMPAWLDCLLRPLATTGAAALA